MESPSFQRVTQLLIAWGQGEQAALDRLLPLVQAELIRLAHWRTIRERPGPTLQTTVLVGEEYLRLIDAKQVQWQHRVHSFAMSSRLMRRILVDFARSRRYPKRRGGAQRVTFDETLAPSPTRRQDLAQLDDAITGLAQVDERKAASWSYACSAN